MTMLMRKEMLYFVHKIICSSFERFSITFDSDLLDEIALGDTVYDRLISFIDDLTEDTMLTI